MARSNIGLVRQIFILERGVRLPYGLRYAQPYGVMVAQQILVLLVGVQIFLGLRHAHDPDAKEVGELVSLHLHKVEC